MSNGMCWRAGVVAFVFLLTFGAVANAETLKRVSQTCDSGFKVTLELPDGVPMAYQPLKARFKITDASGKPVSDALVYCSLYLPKVATGSNRPSLKVTDTSGVYEGILLFSQSGDWHAALTLNLPGGVYEELVFEIDGVVAAN